MEKNMYETYEFLPTNSAQAEADQFFVLQNDGTLLISRQTVQCVEVQDAKGVLENGQPCSTVYDVSSQQYYVDVDNSTELISVSALAKNAFVCPADYRLFSSTSRISQLTHMKFYQFALPQDGTNSDFGNNYLLQSIPSIPASSFQMAETAAIDELKELNIKIVKEETDPSIIQGPETTNFTEVTLNDEQYQTLEIKGWVLLESGGKVYLLNTLGLHDITDNTKLIEDLRNDVEVIEPSVLNDCTTNSATSHGFEEIVSIATEPVQPKQETQSILPDTVAVIQNSYEEAQGTESSQECPETLGSSAAEVTGNEVETTTEPSNCNVIDGTFGQLVTDASTQPEKRKPTMIVRLKTNLAVEDIPNKIVLGKTASGKRLVAKVMNIKRPTTKVNSCSKNNPQEPDNSRDNAPVMTKTVVNKKSNKEAYYRAKEVESLIQKHMESATELTNSAEDVRSAEVIVRQLLNVPATRTPMLERYLIITKIVKTMNDAGNLEGESEPSVVTGRVAQFDDKGEWHFIYVPDLLQRQPKDVNSDEREMPPDAPSPLIRQVAAKALDEYILHVHVVETKCNNEPTKTSINFSKKLIPAQLQLLSNKAIYACSACAKIFCNERDLNEHQTIECMEVEEEKAPLIIDTDKMSKQPTNILQTQELMAKNSSHCPYCNAKVKLSNYKRHLQSHIGPAATVDTSSKYNEDGKTKPTRYKCKMCSTTYYHASTLSKHILSHHIKSNICLV